MNAESCSGDLIQFLSKSEFLKGILKLIKLFNRNSKVRLELQAFAMLPGIFDIPATLFRLKTC